MKVLVTGGSGFIGTNLIQFLAERGVQVLNLSLDPPLDPRQHALWRVGDIMDAAALRREFASFAPDRVVHLAARTDCREDTTVEESYTVNTTGTQNVLDAVKATPSISRVIITSSQFVCGPGYLPKREDDYHPVTVYGQSKVITEQLTRQANLACCWTLVRPTNVWGPWHMRYRREAWRAIARGFYAHPGGKPVTRSYAYIGNVVRQMNRILELPAERVNGKVLYLGDPPGDIYEWVNGFSLALAGRPARRVPRPLLRAAAWLGDAITLVRGRKFYITSSRYRSMTTDYVVPLQETYEVLGRPEIPLDTSIQETVEWLRSATQMPDDLQLGGG
jgi:nucleoside-diphosphate-sugar epimerase